MDKLLYIAGSGASLIARDQALHANNLANISTGGFRADLGRALTSRVSGDGHDARSFGAIVDAGIDLAEGPRDATGRNLDIAVQGAGFIAVQMPDGREAYSRDGHLRVDSFGLLTNGHGLPVLGDAGPVVLPPFQSLQIGRDGTISVQPQGQGPETLAQVGRIKLVNPDPALLRKDPSGQIVRNDGIATDVDPRVQVLPGFLESSNVNAVSELVAVLDLARQFELDVKMMRTAQENDEAASRLLQIG